MLPGAQPLKTNSTTVFFGLFSFVSLAPQSCSFLRSWTATQSTTMRCFQNGTWKRGSKQRVNNLPQNHRPSQDFSMLSLLFNNYGSNPSCGERSGYSTSCQEIRASYFLGRELYFPCHLARYPSGEQVKDPNYHLETCIGTLYM